MGGNVLPVLFAVFLAFPAVLAAPDVTTELLTEPLAGIAYTPDCLVECHLPLRLVFGEDYTVSVPADFAANLTEGTGDYGFETIVFKMLVNVTEQRSRWVPNLQCSPFEEPVDNGTLTVENCTDLGHEENYSVDVRQWQPFDPLGFTFNAGEPYVVDLVGTRKAQLGDAGVDAHFCFGNVCTEEFAWWDSTYVYRYNLTFSRSGRRAEPQAVDVSTLNGSLRCLRVVQDDSTELPWEWWHENRQAPLVDDTIRFFADADIPTAIYTRLSCPAGAANSSLVLLYLSDTSAGWRDKGTGEAGWQNGTQRVEFTMDALSAGRRSDFAAYNLSGLRTLVEEHDFGLYWRANVVRGANTVKIASTYASAGLFDNPDHHQVQGRGVVAQSFAEDGLRNVPCGSPPNDWCFTVSADVVLNSDASVVYPFSGHNVTGFLSWENATFAARAQVVNSSTDTILANLSAVAAPADWNWTHFSIALTKAEAVGTPFHGWYDDIYLTTSKERQFYLYETPNTASVGAQESAPTNPCANGVQDPGEEAADCGGSCPACGEFEVKSVLVIQTVKDVPLIKDKAGLIYSVVRWNSTKLNSVLVNLTYLNVIVEGVFEIELDKQTVNITANLDVPVLLNFSPAFEGTNVEIAADGTTKFSEQDMNNNRAEDTVNITSTERFRIAYVPIDYNFRGGVPRQRFMDASSTQHEFVNRTYPLSEENVPMATVAFPYNLTPAEKFFTGLPSPANQIGFYMLLNSVRQHAVRYGSIQPQRAVGLFQPGLFSVGGYAKKDGESVVTQDDGRSNTAHEIGHTLGLCDEYSKPLWLFEYFQRLPEGCPNGDRESPFGLDDYCVTRGGCNVTALNVLVPWVPSELGEELLLLNVMGDTTNPDSRWVDAASYNHLINRLSSPEVVVVPERIMIAGLLFRNDSSFEATFKPLEHLDAGEIILPDESGGNFSIELLNDEGGVLASINFTPTFALDFIGGEEANSNVTNFIFVMEKPSGPVSVRIRHENTLVARRYASGNPPTLSIISPLPGIIYSDRATIAWNASDKDGDILVYSVGVSADNGSTWHSMIADFQTTSTIFDLNNSLLSASEEYLVRVRAMDGFYSQDEFVNSSFEISPDCIDSERDSVCDVTDNCPESSNPLQDDFESDGIGDVCDSDDDNDGVLDVDDACHYSILPEPALTKQLLPEHYADIDGDGIFETVQPNNKGIIDATLTLASARGCSCAEILEIKPGVDSGEIQHGCTQGTMDIFIKRLGWARNQ